MFIVKNLKKVIKTQSLSIFFTQQISMFNRLKGKIKYTEILQ